MNDTAIIGALIRRANKKLKQAGMRSQGRSKKDGTVEHRFLFPDKHGRLISFSHAMRPTTEIGAGKIAKKIKAGAKQAVKSKAFGKVLKAASVISAVVPGGQAAAAGLAAAATAQQMAVKAANKGKKAVQAIKKGVKGAKAVVKAGKQIKAAVKGKSAAKSATQALATAKKQIPAVSVTRPGNAPKGVMVTTASGQKAIVTFVK